MAPLDRYREAGPQLLLQAYLQKVANGGGRIEREYALGRGRVDLLIVWPRGGRDWRFVVECKVRHDGLERTIREGVEQTRDYMDRCGAEPGHLAVFDRSPSRTWEEKIFRRQESRPAALRRSPSGGCDPRPCRAVQPRPRSSTPRSPTQAHSRAAGELGVAPPEAGGADAKP